MEHRPQQADMAFAVAQKMQENSPLLFEAGTGVGKSLAYLIPGILQAVESRRPSDCIFAYNFAPRTSA